MPQVGFDVKEISGRHSDRMIIGEGNTCLSPAGATRVNAHIRASVTLLYIYWIPEIIVPRRCVLQLPSG